MVTARKMLQRNTIHLLPWLIWGRIDIAQNGVPNKLNQRNHSLDDGVSYLVLMATTTNDIYFEIQAVNITF